MPKTYLLWKITESKISENMTNSLRHLGQVLSIRDGIEPKIRFLGTQAITIKQSLKHFPSFYMFFCIIPAGYFLLHYLCEKVGQDNFFQLLRHYIHDLHHGKLVHSTDFLALYFEKYPLPNKTSDESIQETCLNWLDTDKLPAWIVEKYQSIGQKYAFKKKLRKNTGCFLQLSNVR